MKKKGIVAQTEERMEKEKKRSPMPSKGPQHAPAGKNDSQIISESAGQVEALKDAQNIQGRLRVNRGFVRVYDLSMTVDSEPRNYVAFVYPVINANVLEFLVTAAQNNSFVGLLKILPNCTIMKTYKG